MVRRTTLMRPPGGSMLRRVAFSPPTMAALLLLAAALVTLLPVTVGAVGAGAGDRIYWANEWGSEPLGVRVGSLDGTGSASTLVPGNSPCGVAIDPAAGKIYWANWGGGIQVANLDGTGASTLFGQSGNLCGVAIDPAANKIYWANYSADTIQVGNLNGTGGPSTLFTEPSGSNPLGVAIDPEAGKVYWADYSAGTIRSGNLDGSTSATSPETLFSGGSNPVGVAVDPAAGKIYWTEAWVGLVRVGPLSGSTAGPAETLFDESSAGGLAIDPEEGKIYWATLSTGLIRVGNLNGTDAATLFGDPSIETMETNPIFAALLKTPVGTALPAISETGGVLTCNEGSWAPDLLGAFLYRAPQSFAYQWLLDGGEIDGATASTYTPNESGKYTCAVTASNHAGSASQTSASLAWWSDETDPVITFESRLPAANGNGWNNADVVVTWSCTDAGSGVVDATVTDTISAEGAGQTAHGTCTDRAGNTASANMTDISIDKTGPSAVLAVTAGTAGTNGWHTSGVTVETSGSDSISGPTKCTVDQLQTAETAGTDFNGSCTNAAGLTTNATKLTVKLDKTGPSAVLAVTAGTPGAHGWYTSNVTVGTSGSDSISDRVVCSADQNQTTATTGQVFNGSCTNDAGLTTDADPLTVKLDKTAPTVSLTGGPAHLGAYNFGFVPASPTCTSSDDTSGIDTCGISGYDTAVGTHTVTAAATDNAGNMSTDSHPYIVNAWTLKGFFQPVDMNGVWNTVKNGSTVPLKFQIFAGPTQLTSTAYVKSVMYAVVPCAAAGTEDAIEEIVTTVGTVLRYDGSGGQFIDNWKTPNTANKCYRVTMTTRDGSASSALFKLK